MFSFCYFHLQLSALRPRACVCVFVCMYLQLTKRLYKRWFVVRNNNNNNYENVHFSCVTQLLLNVLVFSGSSLFLLLMPLAFSLLRECRSSFRLFGSVEDIEIKAVLAYI